MGIGYRLRGVETANRAQAERKLAMADPVCVASVDQVGRLDGCREQCGVDSKHTGARAGLEAVAVRGRVGRHVRMFCSGRVEGYAMKHLAGTG